MLFASMLVAVMSISIAVYAHADETVFYNPVNTGLERLVYTATLTSTIDTIDLEWEAPEEEPTSYKVAWAPSNEDYTSSDILNQKAVTTDSFYTITGLEENTEYKVRIKALYDSGSTIWTFDMIITTGQLPSEPEPVPDPEIIQYEVPDPETTQDPVIGNKTSVSSGVSTPIPAPLSGDTIHGVTMVATDHSISVDWQPPTEGDPKDYRIAFVETTEEKFKTFRNLDHNAFPIRSQYTITDLEEDTEYKIKIRPRYNGGPPGPWTDDLIIRTLPGQWADVFTSKPLPLPQYIIEPVAGSSVPGCEDTVDGCSTPNELTIPLNNTVTFKNTDNTIHRWMSGEASDLTNVMGSVFDSRLMFPGETYLWTPITIGTQQYTCILHPWMTGSIIATASDQVEEEETTPEDIEPPQPQSHITLNTTSARAGDTILVTGQMFPQLNTTRQDADGIDIEPVLHAWGVTVFTTESMILCGYDYSVDDRISHDHDDITHTHFTNRGHDGYHGVESCVFNPDDYTFSAEFTITEDWTVGTHEVVSQVYERYTYGDGVRGATIDDRIVASFDVLLPVN